MVLHQCLSSSTETISKRIIDLKYETQNTEILEENTLPYMIQVYKRTCRTELSFLQNPGQQLKSGTM